MQGCLGKWNPCLLPGTTITGQIRTVLNTDSSRKDRFYSSKKLSNKGSSIKNVSNNQTLTKNKQTIANSSKHDYSRETLDERKHLIEKEKQHFLYHFQLESVSNPIIMAVILLCTLYKNAATSIF